MMDFDWELQEPERPDRGGEFWRCRFERLVGGVEYVLWVDAYTVERGGASWYCELWRDGIDVRHESDAAPDLEAAMNKAQEVAAAIWGVLA